MKPISGIHPVPFYAQVDWKGYIEAIRENVKMGDVFSVHLPFLSHRGNRCSCPIQKAKAHFFILALMGRGALYAVRVGRLSAL